MATFADVELEERRRSLQGRKPKPRDLVDVRVPAGSAIAGQAQSVGAQGVRPGSLRPGTVSGVTIRNGTITAPHIVAGTITANEIHSGTITANEIDTGHLGADDAFIGTLTSNFIGTHALVADNIAAGQINSNHIDTTTLTASEAVIDWLAVGFGSFGGLGAGAIEAGALAVGEIASGTINASQFNIGGSTSVPTAQIRALDMADHVRATMDASGFNTYDAAGNVMWSANTGVTSIGIQPHVVGTIHIVTDGLESDGIHDYAILTDHIYAGAVGAGSIAANCIVASHIAAQKITGINIYASGFSNNETDALKKFVLDVNGLHIRTSNAQTSAYQFVDFFGGDFSTRAWICYDYFSGFDQLRVGMVGKMLIDATRVDIQTSARIAGVCRIVGGVTSGEFQVEGSQIGLYACVRMRAAAAGHWYGCGIQFRGRRVDGGGAGAAPSTVSITQTLQNSQITSVDYASLTSYGAMFSVVSSAAGDCFYTAHFSTN